MKLKTSNSTMVCKQCGFDIEIRNFTVRKQLKAYRDYLILAKLFTCKKCTEYIQKKIKELKEEK